MFTNLAKLCEEEIRDLLRASSRTNGTKMACMHHDPHPTPTPTTKTIMTDTVAKRVARESSKIHLCQRSILSAIPTENYELVQHFYLTPLHNQ